MGLMNSSKNKLNSKTYWQVFMNSSCEDSICNDPKFVLGLNVKGPNNKFVERGCQRVRLTLKKKND